MHVMTQVRYFLSLIKNTQELLIKNLKSRTIQREKIIYRLIATAMNSYQSSYVAQNNELQVQGPNVSIRGSSSVE